MGYRNSNDSLIDCLCLSSSGCEDLAPLWDAESGGRWRRSGRRQRRAGGPAYGPASEHAKHGGPDAEGKTATARAALAQTTTRAAETAAVRRVPEAARGFDAPT